MIMTLGEQEISDRRLREPFKPFSRITSGLIHLKLCEIYLHHF